MISTQKFNRFNKSASRILVLTDKFIAKLDAKKFVLMKVPIKLQTVGLIENCTGKQPRGTLKCTCFCSAYSKKSDSPIMRERQILKQDGNIAIQKKACR